ncbi:hypothetical protein SAMN04489745_2280 [Arthrobacter woluwensis]|uniref:Uncharacterized protein n=1 Tax=Arthrobacter woluwensis TaxID=156980 RepID=A0A1H4QGL1_9MICC|nr:hypothetical protein SAMN04489745_2280 [Arthrobacter woluwensis]
MAGPSSCPGLLAGRDGWRCGETAQQGSATAGAWAAVVVRLPSAAAQPEPGDDEGPAGGGAFEGDDQALGLQRLTSARFVAAAMSRAPTTMCEPTSSGGMPL